jgi:hypothetical protein
MLRKSIFLLPLMCLAGWSVMTIGCGGSSHSSPMGCTGGPFNVVGDWTLSVSGTGASSSGAGVISSSGLAVFFQTTNSTPAPGDTVVMPAITGTCSFSGTTTAYGTSASGGGTATASVQGNVSSAASISGTVSNGNKFSLVPNSPLSGSVSAFSGNMIGSIGGWIGPGNLWQLSFSPAGNNASMSFNGSDVDGCNVSGTFNQEGGNASTLNVFDVSMSFSGTGCPVTGTVTGLGFESNSDYFGVTGGAQGTYLYAVPSNSATVFEIFPPQL